MTTQNVVPVTNGHPVVVGRPVEGEVTWLDVPSYPKHRWAYLDGRRVVVDAETHDVGGRGRAPAARRARHPLRRQNALKLSVIADAQGA